jgi:hypothetical protein
MIKFVLCVFFKPQLKMKTDDYVIMHMCVCVCVCVCVCM